MKIKMIFLQIITVAFLVACGSGGGRQAIADVSQAAFDALVGRVSNVERDLAALGQAPIEHVVDANGDTVGEVIGYGSNGMAVVRIQIGSLWYRASIGPNGSWSPVDTYHHDSTCGGGTLVDRREIQPGFDFVFSTSDNLFSWERLQAGTGPIVPMTKREAYQGQCVGVSPNPRLAYYVVGPVGQASQPFTPPYHIQ